MSELQKRIQKVQRRESGARMGFGPVSKELPRAMLLIARAADAAGAKASVEAGADLALIDAADASAAATALAALDKKAGAGAVVPSLDEAGAAALRAAGCDFVVSGLATTAAAAVKTDEMGQVVVASSALDDTTLRALGPLQLDALFLERENGPMTLGQQLEVVRIASLSNCVLLVTTGVEVSLQELRVLRDSGCAAVVIPAGASKEAIGQLVERLKAVPPPRKGGKKEHDIAMVPSLASHAEEHDHDDEDDE